jgi:hypothetical protein
MTQSDHIKRHLLYIKFFKQKEVILIWSQKTSLKQHSYAEIKQEQLYESLSFSGVGSQTKVTNVL